MPHEAPTPNLRRAAVTVRGVVQGVGFRPFVYRIARDRGLRGWVQNDADAVRMEVFGPAADVATFLAALRGELPAQSRIDSIEVRELSPGAEPPASARGFEIRPSPEDRVPRPNIPTDLATCAACLGEVRDAGERRYRYPFTNCTSCGPRWSIIRQLPYDRARTSMSRFALCPACRSEYDDPGDRRFHAQPIACPSCGPHLRLLDAPGRLRCERDGALRVAAEAILDGRVVAVQGLGGFQLLVDATDVEAVARLRRRKHRPHRPFAVMVPTIEAVKQSCEVSPREADELVSPAAPILLLRRSHLAERDDCVAPNVAPDNPYLGVMLPYTPLHHLLMEAVARPIVCTSGNLSDEPMAIDVEDALGRLGGLGSAAGEPIADLLLVHDRPIVRPVDDSVTRVGPDGLQVLRRARGFAPLPIKLSFESPPILAVGGHLKNTVALAIGGAGPSMVVMSPHIGDLESSLSLDVFRRAIDDLLEFFAVDPQKVACDLHPDYASTRHAEELSQRFGAPLVRVQHHHAHVAAAMAEHGLSGTVLGLSWDGAGYGPDGTIWGGEALLCRGGEFRRAAHLRTFPLPGGDLAARQPRRAALGILHEIFGPQVFEHTGDWFSPAEQRVLGAMLASGLNCPRTSSLGRLFDAVAALCGCRPEITFEGQAAMQLEFSADPDCQESYELSLVGPDAATPAVSAAAIADWEPMIRQILADRRRGDPIGRIAARFHNALARLGLDLASAVACDGVVLTGGCFQNDLLTRRVRLLLLERGFAVHTHRQVPPGDGGIALGQVFVAAQSAQGLIDVSWNPRQGD